MVVLKYEIKNLNSKYFRYFSCSHIFYSAAALILKNAGGKVYNYDFTEWDYKSKGIIVTNGKVCLEEYKDKYSS